MNMNTITQPENIFMIILPCLLIFALWCFGQIVRDAQQELKISSAVVTLCLVMSVVFLLLGALSYKHVVPCRAKAQFNQHCELRAIPVDNFPAK